MSDRKIYSVSEITKYFKQMVRADMILSDVVVEGEVSNLIYHKTGHIYFTLKDQGASLSVAMWSSRKASGLTFPMQEGDKVKVHGSFDVYEPRGSYSIIASRIEQAGLGDLYQKFL
ncbi:MAG: exodeoxyribonuclease VII large subunit, partial [Lachnospiraceae bacterium]|nr:exodeoxyribonuclease VII large subunit [Lachnospiraceae bacterium]